MTIVIVGNGPAAVAAAEAIREFDVVSPLTLISKECSSFYSPCPLAEYVEQSVAREDLFLRDDDFYSRHGITTLLGHTAFAIDPTSQLVKAVHNGQPVDVHYERLLIASGARAVLPPVPGLADTPGVFNLKTLDDADAIIQRLHSVRHAVVIGSGFIGLEAAQALHRRGVAVTVLEAMDRVLPQMLDAEFASRVQSRLASFGIDVWLNSPAQAVLGGASGVTSVIAGDREIDCQLVVCAAGVRADVTWLQGSGIATNRGVIVDDRMRTNLAGVYAAGDVIETSNWTGKTDIIPTWPNAVASGHTAGLNMVDQTQHFSGLVGVNVVRIFDQAVSSFGVRDGDQTLSEQNSSGVRKLFLAQGRIIGGQFIGDVTGTGIYLELMKKRVDVSAQTNVLLSPRFTLARLLPTPPRVRVIAA
jgi:NADPH-dependent 2,4-dienoyl-CoA reductase/sulfur reductase-like enzyme